MQRKPKTPVFENDGILVGWFNTAFDANGKPTKVFIPRRDEDIENERVEMADKIQRRNKYRGNPGQDGIAAVKADDRCNELMGRYESGPELSENEMAELRMLLNRKSRAGAPGSLDTTKSPAERDALRNKGE